MRNDFARMHNEYLDPDKNQTPQLCEECHEPICEHGICWCDDAEGCCHKCLDREEAEYQAEQNAKWYEGWNEIFDKEEK